jgi:mannose-6-phosphate isomerase-like protein (cupin superfamily)
VFGNIFGAQKFDKKALVKASLASSDRLGLGLMCFEPGQAQEVHSHDGSDKLYFVVEGVAHVTVGKSSENMGPGTFALAKAGEPHAIGNRGRDRLTVLSVVAPPPPAKE